MNDIKTGFVNEASQITIAAAQSVSPNQSQQNLDLNKTNKIEFGYKSRTREVSPAIKTVRDIKLENSMSETSSLIDQRLAKSRLMQQFAPNIMAPTIKLRSTSNTTNIYATTNNPRTHILTNLNSIFTTDKKSKKSGTIFMKSPIEE